MFTAIGTLDDGTPFELVWSDGRIVKTGGILAVDLLELRGRDVGVTATGPFVTWSEEAEADPRFVVAALNTVGRVTSLTGPDAPTAAAEEIPDGAVA